MIMRIWWQVIQGLIICYFTVASAAAGEPPKRMLWCWISDADLKFMEPEQAGVAFHAASLYISGRTGVSPEVRRNPLRLAPGTYEMPVVRIEYESGLDGSIPKTAFSLAQRNLAARMIAEVSATTRAPAIQIDFDAPKSAWPFYRDLLRQVRGLLGRDVFLSITALTSWCGTSSWLAGVDVDEIVPMTFRMGPAGPSVRTMLASGGQFGFSGCRVSAGVSTHEPVFPLQHVKRVYIFPDYLRWTPEAVAEAFRRVKL